jgi:glycosyltransferase involved in cell wall biosynthesis
MGMHIYMVFLSEYAPETRLHKEARTLASAGHDVTVFALWRPGQRESEEIAGYHIKRLRLFTSSWRGRFLAPLVKFIEFSLRLWYFYTQNPAQVVQANDAKALPLSWLCALTGRAALIYDARELETGREFENFRLAGIYRRLWPLPEMLFIRSAQAVITVSDAISRELCRLYSIPPPLVIMNCPPKQSSSPTRHLHKESNIPDSHRIALFQGSVSAGRGILAFLEAVQILPAVSAVVLGDGPLLPLLRKKVQSGEFQRVILPGRVPMEDLPGYIASADLGIALYQDTCLSHRYALPNKLFEYIQAGLPVVASNLPEIARIVEGYQLGKLVNPDDSASIAETIRLILEDPHEYARLKANTRRAAEVLNWEVEEKKLLTLYKKIEAMAKQ